MAMSQDFQLGETWRSAVESSAKPKVPGALVAEQGVRRATSPFTTPPVKNAGLVDINVEEKAVSKDVRVPLTEFEQELRWLINKQSLEHESNTADTILAEYLAGCLNVFNIAVKQRERWYGRKVF